MGAVDDRNFQKRINKLAKKYPEVVKKALGDIGIELLRLSQIEVPHDTGHLQNSGETHMEDDGTVIVGYHTPYAARLHEHPEYNFQQGRKGKYLEDPFRINLPTFRSYLLKELEKADA